MSFLKYVGSWFHLLKVPPPPDMAWLKTWPLTLQTLGDIPNSDFSIAGQSCLNQRLKTKSFMSIS